MKKRIDFILKEDEYMKLVFRFLPRQSSCHSFNNEPPKSWDDVYKVYYAYKIFRVWKNDNFVEELFYCNCDECSIIRGISKNIEYIASGKKSVVMKDRHGKEHIIELLGKEADTVGDGVSWTINKRKDFKGNDIYQIILWDYRNKGFRFYLKEKEFSEFGKYLNRCCEYMLEHGVPI